MAYVDCSDELWREVARIVAGEGLELYDLERPTNGSLRVTLARPFSAKGAELARGAEDNAEGGGESDADVEDGDLAADTAQAEDEPIVESEAARGGITSGDCSRVCRKLMAFCEAEGARLGLGTEPELDVSSPGLDRSLRLPRHYEQAVGKIIRCIPKGEKAWMEVNGKPLVGVLRGELESFREGSVHIREERTKALVVAALDAIKRANVEFLPEG